MRRFTIFGSRLFFWLLAPWVVGGLVVFPYVAYCEFSAHELFGVVVASILSAWCISILLMAISPQRFGWLILFISGSISAGYMWYFYDTYFVQDKSLFQDPGPVHGLEVYGIHLAIFTISGIRAIIRRRQKKEMPLDR